MYVGFSRFLMVLAAVGLGFGVVFGAGVAGRPGPGPKETGGHTATGAAGAGAAGAGAGAAGAGGGGFGGFSGGAAGGGAAVTGSVDTVSATSMTVKTTTGESVTLALNPQTAVRKLDNGAVSDIK